MIKFLVVLLTVFTASFSYGQSFTLKGNERNGFELNTSKLRLKEYGSASNSEKLYKKADISIPLLTLGIVSLISPMVVFEDKKTFFALTKEVSIGKIGLGRLSFEYSYIFRDYNRNHLRFSYNYDYIIDGSDFIAIVATPGVGYFTDTENKGWFLQSSAGAFLLFDEFIIFNPYLRYRHTFTKDQLKSDINDVSLGMAFILYL